MAYGAGGAVCRLSILGHLSLLKKKEIDGGGEGFQNHPDSRKF